MKWFVEALTGPEQFDQIASEWASLDAQISPRTPFTSPLWNALWWKHFQRRGFLATDHFFVHTIRAEGGELIAVAPLMLTARPSWGPLKVRVLNFFGADTSITELRGIACRRDHQDSAVQILAECFQAKQTYWDIVIWSGLRSDGNARNILQERGAGRGVGDLPTYVMQLPKTWDELRLSLSANMRKNIRKAYESLESAGHKFSFQINEEPQEVAHALSHFFSLHAKRARAQDMVSHPDKFASFRNHAFLTELAHTMAERGNFRIFELAIGSSVVASRLAFLYEQDLYFYYAGYDPSWRDHSVMTILMTEALKWAIARGVKIANLSTGKDQSKLRWRPSEYVVSSFMQTSPTFYGAMSGRVYDTYLRARSSNENTKESG